LGGGALANCKENPKEPEGKSNRQLGIGVACEGPSGSGRAHECRQVTRHQTNRKCVT